MKPKHKPRLLADGSKRYDVRLRDPTGKVRTRTFRTLKEAERYEREQRTAMDSGTWVDPRGGRRTIKDWAEEWLETIEPALSPKTRAQYRSTIRRWVIPAIGHRTLATVTPLDIQTIVSTWARTAKPTTVAHRYAVLRGLFNGAVQTDLIGRSPCRAVKLPSIEPLRRQLPDLEHLERLIAELGPYGAMVPIAVVCGLRWGEVAGLQVRSVDLLRSTIQVDTTVGEASGKIHIGPPKSKAGNRTLAIPPQLVQIIAAHFASRGLTAADRDEWLFVTVTGLPLRYSDWWSKFWVPAREAIGLPKLGFHDLRRLNATTMVTQGVDVKTAQTRVGHANPDVMLRHYSQATTPADRSAADLLGEFFLGPRDVRAMDPESATGRRPKKRP